MAAGVDACWLDSGVNQPSAQMMMEQNLNESGCAPMSVPEHVRSGEAHRLITIKLDRSPAVAFYRHRATHPKGNSYIHLQESLVLTRAQNSHSVDISENERVNGIKRLTPMPLFPAQNTQ